MKKYLFSLTLYSLSLGGFAQTNVYHPFPDSNAVWTQTYQAYSGQACPQGPGANPVFTVYAFSYKLKGDTVINSLTYHKIYKTGTLHQFCNLGNYLNVWNTYVDLYVGAYRQDIGLKKVFKASLPETVLYDFSAVVGTTLTPGCATVTSIDSILIGATYRKRFNLSSAKKIIEGIGCTNGLLEDICPFFENFGSIICFNQNNKKFYPDTIGICQVMTKINEANNFPAFSIAPNPGSGIFNIMGLQIEFTFEIYDITGKSIYKKSFTENKSVIDLSKNNKGIYYYKIFDEQGNSSHGVLGLE